MTLQDWLKEQERSGAWLSRQLGITASSVHHYLQGSGYPSLPVLAQIEALTDDRVRATDFLEYRHGKVAQNDG